MNFLRVIFSNAQLISTIQYFIFFSLTPTIFHQSEVFLPLNYFQCQPNQNQYYEKMLAKHLNSKNAETLTDLRITVGIAAYLCSKNSAFELFCHIQINLGEERSSGTYLNSCFLFRSSSQIQIRGSMSFEQLKHDFIVGKLVFLPK